MNCPTCTAPVADTDEVCRACGAALSRPGSAQPPAPPPATPHHGVPTESRNWAVGAHLGGLILGLATGAVFGFAAPMAVWLMQRDEDRYVAHHAKEALNFQLTVLTAVLAGVVLAIPALIVGVLTLGVGLVLLGILVLVIMVLWLVLPVLAAVKAANGEGHRYPLTIRFVR